VPLVIWLVEEVKMKAGEKNALNDSPIDLALRAHNEEILLFLTLALSEADTGSETTAAIQAQLPLGVGIMGQGRASEQERVLARMFEMDEVRCLSTNNTNPHRRAAPGLPTRFQQVCKCPPPPERDPPPPCYYISSVLILLIYLESSYHALPAGPPPRA